MSQRSYGRALAFSLLLSLLGACTTWQVQEVTPQALLATKKPETIQLTLLDSTRVELSWPHLTGDTIIGARQGRLEQVPVADVLAVAVQEGNGLGTFVALAGGLGLVLLIGFNADFMADSISLTE